MRPKMMSVGQCTMHEREKQERHICAEESGGQLEANSRGVVVLQRQDTLVQDPEAGQRKPDSGLFSHQRRQKQKDHPNIERSIQRLLSLANSI